MNVEFEKICNTFGDECIRVEKNDDSTDGNVYVLYCKNNKYIAKIYNDIIHSQSMVRLHQQLNLSGIAVPKIIYSNCEGANDNNEYIVIYSFITGIQVSKMMQNGKLDLEIVKRIAKVLRKMHDSCVGKNIFNLPQLTIDTYGKRRTVLHFDLTKDNIFCIDSEMAIIDFDDAMYGSAIYDVAILIAFFFFSTKHGVNNDGIKTFIDAYYGEDLAIKNEENPLIKECAINWIDYLLKEKDLDEGLRQVLEEKRKLLTIYII